MNLLEMMQGIIDGVNVSQLIDSDDLILFVKLAEAAEDVVNDYDLKREDSNGALERLKKALRGIEE